MEYNGYSNRDTWLVMLWLNNSQRNYTGVQHLVQGVGMSYNIKTIPTDKLRDHLKRYNYGDKINWDNVNIEEIRNTIIEDFSEEVQ